MWSSSSSFVMPLSLFICVSWSGFCVYCASKVRFLPQLWLKFSPVMSVNIDKFAIPARYVAFEK